MGTITGTYQARIDEKGRITLPSKLRLNLIEKQVKIFPGVEADYLAIMTESEFNTQVVEPLLKPTTQGLPVMFNTESMKLIRKYVSPAVDAEIDSSGRINISQAIRGSSSLRPKDEVILLGVGTAIEVWNPELYAEFSKEG